MLRDAAELSAGSRLSADVCVVGAGAAGITLALALDGTGLRVVVLESGSTEPEPTVQNLAAGEVVGEPLGDLGRGPDALEATRLRFLGGTTGHWSGFCRPLDAIDFEARPELPRSGWPMTRADLDPWYEAALPVLGIGPARFDWDHWGDRFGVDDPLADSDVASTQVFQVSPVRFGSRFRDDLASAADLDVVLHATAVDFVLAEGTDRVEEVRAVAPDGRELSVGADAVVIASGGIDNARLLLAADGQREAGLGNEHDLVGRFFCEHPKAFLGIATSEFDADELARLFGDGATAPRPPASAEGLDDPMMLHSVFTMDEAAVRGTDRLSLSFQALTNARVTDSPLPVDSLATGDVAAVASASQGLAGPGVLYLEALGEQELNPDSRVRLSDDRDASGVRRVALDWRFTERDRRSMVEGIQMLGVEFGRLGLGRLQVTPGSISILEGAGFAVDPKTADPEGFPLGIGYHHMCTTRMAAEATDGVVDSDLRVHSVDNLFVAGSSSFATSGSATPTFTIVALALRLADHLTSELA